MFVEDMIGLEPRTKQLLIVRDKAMQGDMALNVIAPILMASAVNAAIVANTSYIVHLPVQLKTTDYGAHNWFDGDLNASVAKTSTAGVAAINGGATKVTLEGGEGILDIKLTGTWVAGDKITVTITGKTLLGTAVSNAVKDITLG